MHIAITGASGLIGSALARALGDDGHTVLPLVRSASHDPGAVRWDPAAGTIDAAALEGVDAVVHLAGAGIGDKRWSPARKREIKESRTHGTDLLARTLAGLAAPPRVLVSGSAIGYYGDRGDEVVTELSAPGDDFLAGLVAAWEGAAAPAAEAGIRVVHARTGLVFAGEGGVLPRLVLPFRFFVGGRLGSGRQWMSWVSLADEVGALRFLVDRDDISGPVNLVAPEPVTNAEMARAIGQVLHRPAAVPVPAFGPRLVLGREMADELLFVSQRVRPAVLIDAGYPFTHTDVTAGLRAALGR
ncbi:MAG TPA: TIGR01777 family oxidoreductase [Acidimicrobiales bacterium]|nr:TIGR01777 family oxidoreductase [Acidimicrobiales bacterium]